jgi:hypothetical protein
LQNLNFWFENILSGNPGTAHYGSTLFVQVGNAEQQNVDFQNVEQQNVDFQNEEQQNINF